MKITDKVNLSQSVVAVLERGRSLKHNLRISGQYKIEHYDKFGNLLNIYYLNNGIKNAGKDLLLNVMFHGTTPIGTWYVGLIDATGWTADPASDTLASHSGWSEFTSYTGSRKEWTEGATSGGAITNSTPISFAITVDGTLKGLFLASVASGTSGTLWSTANFATSVSVHNGDTFKVTYSAAV